jgi:hypothetical protein
LKAIAYGTKLVYEDKIIYYSYPNYKINEHFCYYSVPDSPYPQHISLERSKFKIAKEVKEPVLKFEDFEEALM